MTEAVMTTTSGRPSSLSVYARRRARMVFLRRRVEKGHAVLMTEHRLIEMARSHLLEDMLSRHGEEGLKAALPEIVAQVRSAMRKSASSLVSDPDGRRELLEDIDVEDLENLFRAGSP